MTTSIIIQNGIKQIVFTPETEDDKLCLSFFTGNEEIEVLVKQGSFGEKFHTPFSANIAMCQGGFLRLYSDEVSKILVLTPKSKK